MEVMAMADRPSNLDRVSISFREYYPGDLPRITEFSHEFTVDDAKGSLDADFVIRVVGVDDENKPVAFGGIKRIYESVMILDPKLSRQDKIYVMENLIWQGSLRSEQLKINYWHAFIKNLEFADILQKHYHFKPCTGEALIVRL